jgi:ABC-type nitrate/sulfonate/bicarbonate transport system substrate-binding protein
VFLIPPKLACARNLRAGVISLVSFFLVIAFNACISHAQTVRISYAGLSGYNVPLWVSQEAGLFKKYGLPAELVLIDGGSTNIQVLLANEARFVNVAGSAPILASVHGAKVVIIAASYNFIPYSLVVNKEIRSVADLKGKRMAITRLGGVTEVAANLALQKLGLGSKDMLYFQVGADVQKILAVQSGTVAATVLSPPALFTALAAGLKVLADLGDLGVKYPTATVATTNSYLAQNSAAVKKFLMAFVQGLHLYKQKREFALAVMQKYTRITNTEALAKTHDYFMKNTALVPFVDAAAIENALPADNAAGRRNVEEFYDNSMLRELVNEGFVEKISRETK